MSVRPRESDIPRFWSKVDRAAGPDACWPWTAATNRSGGYGSFRIGGRMVYAHRFAHELRHGPIPPGLHVLHRCDNPPCVNPAHLFLGTQAENVDDMRAKGRGRNGRFPGEMNPRALVTWDLVREIRRRFAAGGITQAGLARELGLDRMVIAYIVLGKSWPDPTYEPVRLGRGNRRKAAL